MDEVIKRRAPARKRSSPQKDYEPENRRSARIILADPDRYGGETSGLVQWARRVLIPQPADRRTPEGS